MCLHILQKVLRRCVSCLCTVQKRADVSIVKLGHGNHHLPSVGVHGIAEGMEIGSGHMGGVQSTGSGQGERKIGHVRKQIIGKCSNCGTTPVGEIAKHNMRKRRDAWNIQGLHPGFSWIDQGGFPFQKRLR